MWRGICFKVVKRQKIFSEAAAACREDGGTLAMPRDSDTSAFLTFLCRFDGHKCYCWIGLRRQHEGGRFEWLDGSALGDYKPWCRRKPDGHGDCAFYVANWYGTLRWKNRECDVKLPFLCQITPGM
ncbi:collectin-10-like [Branchiostoma lanceolatum]|uniref:collectin-10-like n=1 Tax=Branchiostoma lanceolatum TaxID=7740 RepID=UPI003456B129